MYEDLMRQLRACANNASCKTANCGYKPFENQDCIEQLELRAADAIEELRLIAESYERSAARWAETAGKAVEQIPSWIPVTEKPPKAYEEVLLLFPHNQAAGFCDRDGCWAVYSGDGFYTEVADNETKPTHWARKLPEPPKEEA